MILFSANITGQDCTEIYLIRHAEKDRSDIKNKNPHLNELGKNRAFKWVEVFKNVQFDKIFSTNYNRTIETATPISHEKKIEISIYSPSKIDYENFKSEIICKAIIAGKHNMTGPTNFIAEANKIPFWPSARLLAAIALCTIT